VTKVNVVNRNVATYGKRGNKCNIESIKLVTLVKKTGLTVVTTVVIDICRSLCNVSKFNQTFDFCIDFNKNSQYKI
jgi:hypothetical protein